MVDPSLTAPDCRTYQNYSTVTKLDFENKMISAMEGTRAIIFNGHTEWNVNIACYDNKKGSFFTTHVL